VQRREEQTDGIRMALGATRSDILALVVREGMGLTVLGLVVGVVGALWASSFLSSVLFGVAPRDPVTLGGVAIALCVTSLVAISVPAARAAGIDPVVAIRQE
jgi:putative ABC transport system permease protein